MGASARTCIVTPDIVGPIKNGGIGTHAYGLARHLARRGNPVTLLFTGPCQNGSIAHWKRWYRELGIAFLNVGHLPGSCRHRFEFLDTSYRVYEYLRGSDFDAVHFQDWQACGFHSIQAKRTGRAFANTLLTVMMHSSTQWINEGMCQWNEGPLRDTAMMWAERYCCQYADLLLSPSQHMFDWAESRGWTLAAERRRLPYLYGGLEEFQVPAAESTDSSHLIFFGRLETRKGLSLFLDALHPILADHAGRIRRLSFVGKEGLVHGRSATGEIHRQLKKTGVDYEIHNRWDTFQSLDYIRRSGGVAVIPSLLDNYPFTVLECIENRVPLIAAATGGIPEMVDSRCLFPPQPRALTAKLLELEDVFAVPPRHRYSASDAERRWNAFVAETAKPVPSRDTSKSQPANDPLVSICVPYFNYGRYLPELVDSIQKIDYTNYEVILVNDGSSDPASVEVFQDLERRYRSPRWKFISQANGGVGKARNRAAAHAKGEYLVFMDSDNLAMPRILRVFVDAIQTRRADCLTCYFRGFESDQQVGEQTVSSFDYCPLGPCLELGIFENIFGDANFIVRKHVFDALGGFTEDRHTSWEDYEFLARLNLQGYVQDVVPEPLFWYRNTAEGFSRNTGYFQNTHRVLRAYAEALPPFSRFLLSGIVLPRDRRRNDLGKFSHVHPTLLKAARETQRVLQQIGFMRSASGRAA